jgi:hypothetical protein
MKMMKQIYAGLFLLIACTGWGQSTGIKAAVDKYRTSQDAEALRVLSDHARPKEVAAAIFASTLDTLITDHRLTVHLIKVLERKTTDVASRESYVNALVEILWRSPGTVAASALKVMQTFERKSFSQNTKDDLMTYISEHAENRGEAILLLGFVGNQNDVGFLKSLAHYTSLAKKDKYKVRLALVRLNDAVSVQEYLAELGNRQIDDALVSNVLPDLIYTHHPEVYKILLAELNNDVPACLSANNDSAEEILCAYRILEQIAPQIRDFPVTVDRSGELNGDYLQALQSARAWYVANATSFTINAEHF